MLKEKLGKKRILLTDDQRRRLAVEGKLLGRKMLEQVAMNVTPDTICVGTVNWWPRNGTTAIKGTKQAGRR